jgi:uncharacterized membrane protein
MELSRYLLLNTLWDVFLALIPAALGAWLGAGLRRSRSWPVWLWLPVGVLWLLFLPNTCYLLTEIRHYLENNPYALLGRPAGESPDLLGGSVGPQGIRRFLFWTGFYLVFSSSGLLLFTLAIRPVAESLRERGWPLEVLLPPLFFGSALGVYLGLRLRFNSWDLLRQPGAVWDATWDALFGPGIAGAYIVAFAGFLGAAYWIVDVWIDGFLMRWKRRKGAGC